MGELPLIQLSRRLNSSLYFYQSDRSSLWCRIYLVETLLTGLGFSMLPADAQVRAQLSELQLWKSHVWSGAPGGAQPRATERKQEHLSAAAGKSWSC